MFLTYSSLTLFRCFSLLFILSYILFLFWYYIFFYDVSSLAKLRVYNFLNDCVELAEVGSLQDQTFIIATYFLFTLK